jgi:hypothetical protein
MLSADELDERVSAACSTPERLSPLTINRAVVIPKSTKAWTKSMARLLLAPKSDTPMSS